MASFQEEKVVDEATSPESRELPSDVRLSSDKTSEIESGSQQSRSQHHDFPEGGTRAWADAIGAGGILFSTLGYSNAFGVFQEYYQHHQLQHKSASDIAWIGSLQLFFLFFGTVFGGPLFDRFGAKVIWPAAIAYVFSIMMTSICKEYYQYILAQGLLGGISAGMCFSPGIASVGQYFQKKRGAAMGIAIAGSSIGGVIFPIALTEMLYNPRLGFGWSVRICGFIVLFVIGLSCIGVRARLPPRKGKLFLAHAFKEKLYILVIIAVFFTILGVMIPLFYMPSYAISYGMDPQLANYIVAILNGASFFGRVIPGILADKLGRFNMYFAFALASGVMILCWQATHNNVGIFVFSGFFGFVSGAIISLMSVVFANVAKDPRDIGTYMGMGMAWASIGALIGPPINGALISHYGGYEQASIFSGIMMLIGCVTVVFANQATGKGLLSIF